MRFCAICTSERGPFSMQPLGRNDALVTVCADCNDPLGLSVDAEPHRFNLRVMSSPPEMKLTAAERSKLRRDTNRAIGRCINHPLTGRRAPHGPPLAGKLRCEHCADMHAGRKAR